MHASAFICAHHEIEVQVSIKLSESAANRVKGFLESEDSKALRLGVRQTGCSGWAYVVELENHVAEDDVIFEDRGITVVVSPESLPYLEGSEIDFVADGLNRTFKFQNPNATEECGCGESFTIKAA
jgi:iron-sulfur cluster assembly protein